MVKGTERGSSVSSAVVLSVSMAGVAGALCVSVLQIVLRSCSVLVGKTARFQSCALFVPSHLFAAVSARAKVSFRLCCSAFGCDCIALLANAYGACNSLLAEASATRKSRLSRRSPAYLQILGTKRALQSFLGSRWLPRVGAVDEEPRRHGQMRGWACVWACRPHRQVLR